MKPALILLALALVAVVAACDSSSTPTTVGTTTTFVITTTTLPGDTCEDIAADAADFLEDVVEQLDQTSLDVLTDPESWPRELLELRQQGIALDQRVAVLGCDAAAVQEAAFSAARVDPDGPISDLLVELLIPEG